MMTLHAHSPILCMKKKQKTAYYSSCKTSLQFLSNKGFSYLNLDFVARKEMHLGILKLLQEELISYPYRIFHNSLNLFLTFKRLSRKGLAAHNTILWAGKLRPPAAKVTSTRSPWQRSNWTAETKEVPNSPQVKLYSCVLPIVRSVSSTWHWVFYKRKLCDSKF